MGDIPGGLKRMKEMNAAVSEKWIVATTKKLADGRNHSAVLMLDNAPYNCRALSKPLMETYKMEEIKAWLSEKKVPFSIGDKKPVLLGKMNDWIQSNGRRSQTRIFTWTTKERNMWSKSSEHPHITLFSRRSSCFGLGSKFFSDGLVQICQDFTVKDFAALYRHVDKYVDEFFEGTANKEAAKCSAPTASTSLGGDSENEGNSA
uniref:Uncharacterized protein n=1 Tax=Caenorhabditis japonica TaxID=281687 RepID=A0A8R1EMY9_CAEJA